MAAKYRASPKARLQLAEQRLGFAAALLSDMADALSEYPAQLRIVDRAGKTPDNDVVTIQTGEWPTIEELQRLLIEWREAETAMALSVLHRLQGEHRANAPKPRPRRRA